MTHTVDVAASTALVRVLVAGELVAETRRPLVLCETGYPDRYYIPAEDVRAEFVEPSGTHTFCPYKGEASYVHVTAGGARFDDAAWTYPDPNGDVAAIAGHLSFLGEGVTVLVDGLPAP